MRARYCVHDDPSAAAAAVLVVNSENVKRATNPHTGMNRRTVPRIKSVRHARAHTHTLETNQPHLIYVFKPYSMRIIHARRRDRGTGP